MNQKFHKGDHVYTAHHDAFQFSGGAGFKPKPIHSPEVEGIILGSYTDLYGTPGSGGDYSVFVKGSGSEAWFPESKTRLIEAGRLDLLNAWEGELEAFRQQRADMDWIFANGAEVIKSASGATLKALGGCVGVNNLWGSHGEGMAYYENAHRILHVAKPFLETGDKAGWLEWSKSHKLDTIDYEIR